MQGEQASRVFVPYRGAVRKQGRMRQILSEAHLIDVRCDVGVCHRPIGIADAVPAESVAPLVRNKEWFLLVLSAAPAAEPKPLWVLAPIRKEHAMAVHQGKIAPPRREHPDVLLCQSEIKSLEQENAWLKERLAQILREK